MCPLNSSSGHYLFIQVATYIPAMTFQEAINVAELPLILYLSSSSVSSWVISSNGLCTHCHHEIEKLKHLHYFLQISLWMVSHSLGSPRRWGLYLCLHQRWWAELFLHWLREEFGFCYWVIGSLSWMLSHAHHASSVNMHPWSLQAMVMGEYFSRCSSCWQPIGSK